MNNHETTIRPHFAALIRPMRSTWKVYEEIRPYRTARLQPDVFITEEGRKPIPIELKIDNEREVEEQTQEHLGQILGEKYDEKASEQISENQGQLSLFTDENFGYDATVSQSFDDAVPLDFIGENERVSTAVAVSIPREFRDMDQTLIPERLKDADNIRYILLSERTPSRFPKRGWLTGGIADIAAAIRVEATPVSELKEAAWILEEGIEKAADIVKVAREERPKIGREMEACLRQAPSKQTDRMAMLIISNAFVFQSTLAGIPRMEDVPALADFEETYGKIDPLQILSAWQQITEVNYHPIFNVAIRLVKALYSDGRRVAEVLSILRHVAQKLVYAEITQAHELAGIVFQKLITNRKFTKANYTFPESAALLCALVLPKKLPTDVLDLKVADFACGTGALLNGAYQRMLHLHEQNGKNINEDTQEYLRDIHQYMMENNLVGCDIMPNAVHITASIIASTYPRVQIGKTRIHCMKYGDKRKDGFYSIGALNLLRNPAGTLPLDISKSDIVGGHGDVETETGSEFRHEEFDYVIMNPPYTKSNSDIKTNLPKTIFGDHENGAEMRKTLKAQKSKIGNFQAGLGTFFFDLADKMLKPKGTLGFVLPASALTGVDWYKLRNLLAQKYHNIMVITIADGDIENSTFSADTNMAECLVVATKGCVVGNTGRAKFVTLNRRPESELEALEIANSIRKEALEREGFRVYNPRSRTFLEQPEIQAALGALVRILDPDEIVLSEIKKGGVRNTIDTWIQVYTEQAEQNSGLLDYVNCSINRIKQIPVNEIVTQSASQGATRSPATIQEIFYHMISLEPFATWQQDVEQTVRLGKLSKVLESYCSLPFTGSVGSTRGNLRTDRLEGGQINSGQLNHLYYSLVGLLVAEGLNDPEDEEIICPPGRFPIMTVHQAKGLEFPFVFVSNLGIQEGQVGAELQLEDAMHPFRTDSLLPVFNAQERADQDRIRFFYVAYSRAVYSLILLTTNNELKNQGIGFGGYGRRWFTDEVQQLSEGEE